MGIAFMTLSMVVYTVHMTCQDIDGGATEADGGATEADGGASAPVGPSVATPLIIIRPGKLDSLFPISARVGFNSYHHLNFHYSIYTSFSMI